MRVFLLIIISLFCTSLAKAGEADVLNVVAKQTAPGIFSFNVTVKHDDDGWDHYADKWDILDPDGNILGTRVLHHPHDNEQPFTRSLSSVDISDEIQSVIVRAHDSVHAYGGAEFKLELPR